MTARRKVCENNFCKRLIRKLIERMQKNNTRKTDLIQDFCYPPEAKTKLVKLCVPGLSLISISEQHPGGLFSKAEAVINNSFDTAAKMKHLLLHVEVSLLCCRKSMWGFHRALKADILYYFSFRCKLLMDTS